MKIRVEEVREVRKNLTSLHSKLSTVFCTEEVILELMTLRGYRTQEMYDTLKELGVFRIDYLSELRLVAPDITNEHLRKMGLLTQDGDYLLTGRYVLPIKDIAGNVVALVGWSQFGGPRKYVTTPTLGFSRDVSFFNLDCYSYSWEKWDGLVFLVEGIFDAIALKSLGLPVIANQGLELSSIKSEMLTRFKKVIAIPDNDSSGRSVNPITNAISGRGKKFIWNIKNEHVFVILPTGVKDVDNFVNEFDCYDDLVNCRNYKYLHKLKAS